MRRRRPRALFVSGAVALAGCAAIADLRDPDPRSEATATTGGDASISPPTPTTTTTAPPAVLDASVPDAYAGDGATTSKPVEPPPPTCVNPGKAPNGDPCKAPSECCSAACTQNKICNGSCFKVGEGECDPNKTGECCFGTYCSAAFYFVSPNFRCKTCLEKGVSAETARNIFNQTVVIKASCCSGQVDANGKCE